MGTTVYHYSKKNSVVTIIVMIVLGILFTSNIYKAYYSNDRFDLTVFAILITLLVFTLVIIVAKRLLPALKNEVILEFNETMVIDHLRNITINWTDIDALDFRRTRSSAMIVLFLKWESDHGKDITISLRWVEGKDQTIYNTALNYLDRFSSTTGTAN
jgi:hypothetical protein